MHSVAVWQHEALIVPNEIMHEKGLKLLFKILQWKPFTKWAQSFFLNKTFYSTGIIYNELNTKEFKKYQRDICKIMGLERNIREHHFLIVAVSLALVPWKVRYDILSYK